MGTSLPLPKYHQIYLVLREQLQEGQFDQDGLPGEYTLAEQFGVARVTIRKAMEMLVADGLVLRRPGLGTWPLRAASNPNSVATVNAPQKAHLTGLLENIVNMGLRTSVQVLDSTLVSAPPIVAESLQIPLGTPVHKSLRVRSTEAGPLSHITTYVPQTVADFSREDLEREPLLMLLEAAGVEFGGAAQTISARLADAQVARHLDVSVGSALLAVTRVVRDVNDRPVQLLQGLYRPDRYQYQLQLSRVGSIDAKVWVSEELSAQFH